MARLRIISSNWSMNCSCFWGHSRPWQGKPYTFATRPTPRLDSYSRCLILCCPCCGQWQGAWPSSSSSLSLTLASSLLSWLSNSILRLLPQSAPSEATFQAAMTPGSTLQMQNAKCCQNILQCEFVTQPEGKAYSMGDTHQGLLKQNRAHRVLMVAYSSGHLQVNIWYPQSIPPGQEWQRATVTRAGLTRSPVCPDAQVMQGAAQ